MASFAAPPPNGCSLSDTQRSLRPFVLSERGWNLHQDELAAAAGVGTRFIVDLEKGKKTAEIGKVMTVLEALGCELEIRLSDDTIVRAPKH